MRFVLLFSVLFLVSFSLSNPNSGEDCLEESVMTDSLTNVEAAKAILKKFSTSNSPMYSGRYLRHAAKSGWEENKKDGKVVSRDMSFIVVKQTDKGGCKTLTMKLRQDALEDGRFGSFYVESAVPGTSSPDCECVKGKKDWLNR